jgi:hypothetical protein
LSINATRMSFGKESLTAVHQRHAGIDCAAWR